MKKNGSNAIFSLLRHVCRVIFKYQTKLLAFVSLAESDSVITSAQAATVTAFISAAVGICAVFEILANYQSSL